MKPITHHPILKDPHSLSRRRMNQLEEFISEVPVCFRFQRTVLPLDTHTIYRVSLSTPYLKTSIRPSNSPEVRLPRPAARLWPIPGGPRCPGSTLTARSSPTGPTVLLDNWHTPSRQRQASGHVLPAQRLPGFQPFTLLKRLGPRGNLFVQASPAMARCSLFGPRCIPIALQRLKAPRRVTPSSYLAPANHPALHLLDAERTRDNRKPSSKNTFCCCYRKLSRPLAHQQDYAQTLLALAETIGGECAKSPCRACWKSSRKTAREASAVHCSPTCTTPFAHHHNSGRIFNNEILDFLHGWITVLDEWNKGQPMTAIISPSLCANTSHSTAGSKEETNKNAEATNNPTLPKLELYCRPNDTGGTHEDRRLQGLGFRSPMSRSPITRLPSPNNTTHDPSPFPARLNQEINLAQCLNQSRMGKRSFGLRQIAESRRTT